MPPRLKMPSRLHLLVVYGVIIVLVIACSGSNTEEGPPAILPPPETLVLTLDDMPKGFSLEEEKRIDNRSAAREYSDPDKWFSNYKSWGRIDAWEVTYETGFQKESISSGAVVYQTKKGAREAFKEEREAIKEDLRKQTSDADYEVELREDRGINIGDESYSLRVRFSSQTLGRSQAVDAVAIAILIDNVAAFVSWSSFEEAVLTDDVVQLADRLNERIQGALR